MAIDIANPGVNEASLKAALSALGMPELVYSTTISSPVSNVEISLPSDYVAFEFKFVNWAVNFNSAGGTFFQVSLDGVNYLGGGASYLNCNNNAGAPSSDASGGTVGGAFEDSIGYFNDGTTEENKDSNAVAAVFYSLFWPGSAATPCNMSTIGVGSTLPIQGVSRVETQSWGSSTIGSPGRVQKIKIVTLRSEQFQRGSLILTGLRA